MTKAKLSLILLVFSGVLFSTGVYFIEVDSPKRWGLIIVSLIGVPISFFSGVVSLVKEKDKASTIISTITVTISAAIIFLGLYKIF